MLKMQIILGSNRPGRNGAKIAEWVEQEVLARGDVEVDFVDLAELDLPFMDEPNHPAMQHYTKQHTKDWSKRVAAADGFIFMIAEYNHGYTAVLKNAIDFLNREWNHKPVAFVSYGGVAGGSRAVEQLRQVVAELRMMGLRDQVVIPLQSAFDQSGQLAISDPIKLSAKVMLDDLVLWADRLKVLRVEPVVPAA